MTEHITNTERMTALFAALAQTEGSKTQRREMIKLYGVSSEIFEDSLVGFVQKITLYLQKLLKESEPMFHHVIAGSLGKIVKNVLHFRG